MLFTFIISQQELQQMAVAKVINISQKLKIAQLHRFI